ncbi:hypothetical protein S40288_10675 [Stachybotrys chartarum IBT 40288]|nr:hypothetical protein S40288_10675 [Stachybotrys chartarum IBT 40288]
MTDLLTPPSRLSSSCVRGEMPRSGYDQTGIDRRAPGGHAADQPRRVLASSDNRIVKRETPSRAEEPSNHGPPASTPDEDQQITRHRTVGPDKEIRAVELELVAPRTKEPY